MHKKLGFIINPVAGMGGKVGLKGTDGQEALAEARSRGARPEAPRKALEALKVIGQTKDQVELLTCPGAMGEDVALEAGFSPRIISTWDEGKENTTAEDTRRAAEVMIEERVELILFAGGDGTARDIYDAVGTKIPVLGIPAGVKIHSAVFAVSPRKAGQLTALFLEGKVLDCRQMEVMDIDEEAFRQGRVEARLYGYLQVPIEEQLMQGAKSGRVEVEEEALKSIAQRVIDDMEDGIFYIIGPGTTTAAIMEQLNLSATLLGVDIIRNKELLAYDVGEKEILEMLDRGPARIVVTIIGGQGYIFGRGNQQISAEVIEKVGKENIIVVAARGKILSLKPKLLRVDSGREEIDEMLQGFIKVRTGYFEEMLCRVL